MPVEKIHKHYSAVLIWLPRSCYKRHKRAMFRICDRKTWWNKSCVQGYSFQKSTSVSWVNSNLLKRAYRKLTSRQANVVRLPSTHSIKRSVLVKKKKQKKKKTTDLVAQSCNGNNKHVMFLKLRLELKKRKKIHICIYTFTQNLSKTLPLLAAFWVVWSLFFVCASFKQAQVRN